MKIILRLEYRHPTLFLFSFKIFNDLLYTLPTQPQGNTW